MIGGSSRWDPVHGACSVGCCLSGFGWAAAVSRSCLVGALPGRVMSRRRFGWPRGGEAWGGDVVMLVSFAERCRLLSMSVITRCRLG
jgi:hypothetical protein